MQIIKFEWNDLTSGWQLLPVEFSPFTLLVGPSGAGKTKILKSIIGLQNIITGKTLNGIKWNIEFITNKNNKYRWFGEFETSESYLFEHDDEISTESEKNKPKILNEQLYCNDKLLIEREKNRITFNNVITPKLSSHQSALFHFREEDTIKSLFRNFLNINLNDQSYSTQHPGILYFFNRREMEKNYTTLEDIKESQQRLTIKLYLIYKNCPEMFNKILSMYSDIFPTIEDLKIEPLKGTGVPDELKEYPIIQLKERGVEKWIQQGNISSGMFSTLMHICEILLSANGSVILIDEFENSLGVNCINDIMSEILSTGSNLQFIITSHHPYIINEIDYRYWKLITRKGGKVFARNAGEFNLGKSKHEAFMQLLNLPEFIDGIS